MSVLPFQPFLTQSAHADGASRKFAFPQNATLEQNLRFYVLRESYFTSRKTMPASFDCQRTAPQSATSDRSFFASREAQHSLEPHCEDLRTIKNPASSAGQIRLLLGPLFRAALKRMYSKLECRLSGACNQSHLCFQKARLGLREAPEQPGHHRHQRSIPTFLGASSGFRRFFDRSRTLLIPSNCGYHRTLWKKRR